METQESEDHCDHWDSMSTKSHSMTKIEIA